MQAVSAVFLMLGLWNVAQAGDVVAGKKASAMCAGCHGAAGVSAIGQNPNLAGQNEAYFINTLKAYRDGKRKHSMMGMVSKGLSDADMANLAAYYKSL
ncbi:MAG: cytochrome c [Gammaproteobacteria bacterium]|nr:cytochrome c [Gammaproteobacteria bacterium]